MHCKNLTRAVSSLAGLAAASAAIIQDTRMVSVGADIFKSRSVTIIEVDANNLAPIVGCSTLNVDISLALRLALSGEKNIN